jgi:riboflavin synthase
MFTGIIQVRGRVLALEPGAGSSRLTLDARAWAHRPAEGESVCVSGSCLTAVRGADHAGVLLFDVVPETLAKTTLGGLKPGDEVNLEPSVTPATALSGHLVQGHIDGVGLFERVVTAPEWRVTVRPPPGLMPFIVPKGSVTLDGVSLTVADVRPAEGVFDVALIPVTLAATTLGRSMEGHRCNIECDAIAKTVVHWLRHYAGPRG